MNFATDSWEAPGDEGERVRLSSRPPARHVGSLTGQADSPGFPFTGTVRLPTPTPPAGCQEKTFVVDVYPGLASFAALLLEKAGIPARAYDDRVTAWHAFAFANPKPALLITDDAPGAISGIELIRLCKPINLTLKVLLITHRQLADLTESDRTLVDGVLPKAYCGPLLARKVRELLPSPAGPKEPKLNSVVNWLANLANLA